MEQLGLYFHSIRKKQIKNTISKIDRKAFNQMKKSRSEGLEIAEDYSHQLKRAVRRSKTEKTTFMKRKNQRRRMMTQFKISDPAQLKDLAEIDMYKIDEEMLAENRTQGESSKADETSNKQATNKSRSRRQSLLMQKQNSSQKLIQKPSIKLLSQQLSQQAKPVKKKFLPMLQLYIQQQKCLKEMNSKQKQIRNLIVTMLVLAINRRNNKRLYDALDVLIQTQIYFPEENREMVHLKSVWVQLIGKIYDQIRVTFKQRKEDSRKRTARKSSAKISLQLKHRKTIFIRSLVSRKAFFQKCSENLRKSNLIYESTYFQQVNNRNNFLKTDKLGNKLIYRMQNSKCIVNYPQPKQLYPVDNIQNYAIVMIKKDKQSNIFPLNYPQTLEGFVSKQDYINKIIKINSILIPTTRCLDYQSTIFIHYQFLFLIFALLIISTSFLIFNHSSSSFVAIILSIILIALACYKLHRISDDSRQRGQISYQLIKCCQQWEHQSKQIQLKCTMNNEMNILLISFPIDPHSQESIEAVINPLHQQNRKCSIKVPDYDEVQWQHESNSDSDEDDKFWDDIQRAYGVFEQHIIVKQINND